MGAVVKAQAAALQAERQQLAQVADGVDMQDSRGLESEWSTELAVAGVISHDSVSTARLSCCKQLTKLQSLDDAQGRGHPDIAAMHNLVRLAQL